MLISKNGYNTDDIISFKILNGDEIVAKLVSEDDDSFTVVKPMAIVPSPQGIALMSALFSVELGKHIRLDKKHVMLNGPTVDQIADHYREVTSGIQLPKKGGIIT